MSDLIDRIDQALIARPLSWTDDAILRDCKAEIERLSAVGEPVAWAIFSGTEVVDLTMAEPDIDDEYTSKPLYTAPPSVSALIAELADLKEFHKDLLDSYNSQVQKLIADINNLPTDLVTIKEYDGFERKVTVVRREDITALFDNKYRRTQ